MWWTCPKKWSQCVKHAFFIMASMDKVLCLRGKTKKNWLCWGSKVKLSPFMGCATLFTVRYKSVTIQTMTPECARFVANNWMRRGTSDCETARSLRSCGWKGISGWARSFRHTDDPLILNSIFKVDFSQCNWKWVAEPKNMAWKSLQMLRWKTVVPYSYIGPEIFL